MERQGGGFLSVKLLAFVMAWFGIWLIICPLETG